MRCLRECGFHGGHLTTNATASGRRAAQRLLAAAPAAAAAAGVALVVAHLLNELLLDARIAQFQASAEHTAWTWAASMATLTAGLSAALLAFATARRAPLALGALLVFFALDDFIEVHERLGDATADALGLPDWVGPRLWTLLYLPLLGLVVLLGWRVARRFDSRSRRTVAAGAALLAAGFALEVVGIGTKRLEESGHGTPHMVRAGLEEASELSGWILVAAGFGAGTLAALSSSPPEPRPRLRARP